MDVKKKVAKTLKRLVLLIPVTGIVSILTYEIVLNYNGQKYSEAIMFAEIVGVIGLFIGFLIIMWYPLIWVFKTAN